MSAAIVLALFCTVVLGVVTAYFLLGALPLLTLRHDVPLDASFIRGYFDTYYLAATYTAGATAVSYALTGRVVITAGAAGLALLAFVLRRTVIPRMERLRDKIQANEAQAIASFRRLHAAAIAINLAQLVAIVWSGVAMSIAMK